MIRTAAVIIADALACVAREVPDAHARMCAAFGTRTVALTIGSEIMHLALEGEELTTAAVSVRASVDVLCRILEGETAILDAVLAGDLVVAGGPNDLIATSAAATWFLEGAVRCLSTPPLSAELFSLRMETT